MTYLPGQGQPGPATGFPPGTPGLPPPPHRSYTKGLVAATVAVVTLLIVVGVVGGLLYTHRDTLFGKDPGPFRPASSGKPIYRHLPACDAMPTTTLTTVVPAMEKTLDDGGAPADPSDGPYGACEWGNLESEHKPPDEDRSAKLVVQGYPDSVAAGVDTAKQNLADARSSRQNQAGRDAGGHRYGSVRDLSGLGPGAFAQDYTVQSSTWFYGATDVYFQVDNLLVTVTFIGSDGADGAEKPISTARTGAAAQDIAEEALRWLSSCADCKS